jgi:hypothetical protein
MKRIFRLVCLASVASCLAPLPFLPGCSGSSSGPSGAEGEVDAGTWKGDAGTATHVTGTTNSEDASVAGVDHDASVAKEAGGGGEASAGESHDAAGSARDAADATVADASTHDATVITDAMTASNIHTGPWKIMPLGDSITGTTCYPQLLSKELIDNGRTNFAFVGTNTNVQSCNGAPTVQTEGHGGYDVTYLTTNSPPQSGHGSLSELQTWAAEKPDVVLMHFGTNDCWNGYSSSSILSAYDFVVDQFRSQNPNEIFFVAQIIPLNPSGCTTCESNVETLNGQIPTWASGKSTTASPIHVVNVWSALPVATYLPNSTYTADGVHPNEAGSQLLADVWAPALAAQSIP